MNLRVQHIHEIKTKTLYHEFVSANKYIITLELNLPKR